MVSPPSFQEARGLARLTALRRGSISALGLVLLFGCSSDGTPEDTVDGVPSAGSTGGATFGTGVGGTANGGAGVGGGSLIAPGDGDGDGDGDDSGDGDVGNPAAPLTARTWRLSHEQYRASVLDLVGVEPDMQNFAPESGNGKFANFSSTAFVQVDLAANYYKVAKSLAEEMNRAALAELTSCDLQAECSGAFISELGQRAFRAPVPIETAERLGALFLLAEAERDTETAFRAVLVAILNSPIFLYRKEIGPSEDTASAEFSLTDHQIAEFLSYSLLNAPPPQWLREQVETSGITEASLEATIDQLIDDPAFEAQLAFFLSEWLEVTHFDTVEKSEVYPGFEDAKPLLIEEQAEFFLASGSAEHGLANLLLDSVPTVSPRLEAFYYSDPSAPEEGERLGVLALGTVLASHAKSYLTSPTQRGTFVRGRFFCEEINLPEGFTPPPLSETEDVGTAESTRELYEQHQSNVTCAECHTLTDPIGFSLESFDGVGRFRTLDTTQGTSVPIDTVAELSLTDVNRMLTGPADLSQALSESPQVKECFARQAFRFYFGQVEASAQLPAIEAGRQEILLEDTLGGLAKQLLSTSNTFNRSRETAN